jgi:signal transduction histidine kinase
MTADTKILIVDDDEASRYVKARVLARRGYRVFEAALGAEALRIIDSEQPALVLLDVRLPDVSGIKLCHEIKARLPGTLVLQTSAAFTTASDRTAGLEGGADSYVIEPVEPEELIAHVGSLLRLGHAERQLRTLNERLEQRVADRTSELVGANRRLAEESKQRAQMEEMLRHTEKLDAIGHLTGGVAHDFNNLLTVILNNVELLKSPQLDDRGRARLLDGIHRAALRGANLTSQLLAFARRQPLRPKPHRIDALIGMFEAVLRRACGEACEVTLELNAAATCSEVDQSQFESALLNLVINARDAMPNGGHLAIRTRVEEIDAIRAARFEGITPGQYVRVSIEDDGTGIPASALPRVFEPFFTTKEIGKGSGLGLSQVFGFSKQSGGHTEISSDLGAGTTVSMYLPITGAVPTDAQVQRAPAPISYAQRGTALVVEDDPDVLTAAVASLTSLGYEVLTAHNGLAALHVLRRKQRIDLLFSDVVMPKGLSGIDLAREARRLRPEIKVLLASGYPQPLLEKGDAASEFVCIAKPYRLEELAERLRSL